MSKKVLFILLLIIILIFMSSVSSYAAYYPFEFSFTDKKIDYPHEITDINYEYSTVDLSTYPYYTLLYSDNKSYWLYVSESMPYVYSYKGTWYTINEFTIPEGKCSVFLYSWSNLADIEKGWQLNNTLNKSDMPYKVTGYNPLYTSQWVYSNYDIKNNGVVFHEAYKSPDSPLVQSIKAVNTMKSVTEEIVSILPVVLVIMVSLIAIRKGINFIKTKAQNA